MHPPAGINIVVLDTIPVYNDDCKTYSSLGLPPLLAAMYKDEYADLEYGDLIEKCEELFLTMSITPEEARNISIHNSNSEIYEH